MNYDMNQKEYVQGEITGYKFLVIKPQAEDAC
jgi:hypothetical protein